jgi:hypothetical protein
LSFPFCSGAEKWKKFTHFNEITYKILKIHSVTLFRAL